MTHVLLDTDIDTDCDDVGALAVLHTLQTQRLTTILGVICSVPFRCCAADATTSRRRLAGYTFRSSIALNSE